MTKFKGALIGCGFFAVNQMHGWRDIAEIVAICDRDPERLRIVGDQFGIERRHQSAEDMFAAGGFDFVDIATTVGSHRPLVELAAQTRTDVLSRDEAIERGWFGSVVPQVRPRLGDVVVAARGDHAVVSTTDFPYENLLVGLHGSLTGAEMEIPILTF